LLRADQRANRGGRRERNHKREERSTCACHQASA
jgi:hypothetical protein